MQQFFEFRIQCQINAWDGRFRSNLLFQNVLRSYCI